MASTQILCGFHAVQSRLNRAPTTIQEVFVDSQRQDSRMNALLTLIDQAGLPIKRVEAPLLQGLSQGQRHQGVLAIAQVLTLAKSLDAVLDQSFARQSNGGAAPLLLILDEVTDPHNLGACLRTADACSVDALIAPRDRSAALNATAFRVACGAADAIPYLTVTNLARTLKSLQEDGIRTVGTDDAAPTSLYSQSLLGPLAWVLGSEGVGMRRLTRENCEVLVNIPMLGSVASLNVSVAAGVCLFETIRQRFPV